MNTTRIAREMVRALRGARSQTALSRRLGYRTNVIYRWEAGRDFPSAAKFFNLAARTGVDVGQSLSSFFHGRGPWAPGDDPPSRDAIAGLLDDLRGGTSIVDLAESTGYSRFQVARWLSGDTEPKLPAFLDLVEATSLRLLDFIAAFVDPERLPSVAAPYRDLAATRRAAHDLPWTQAVLRCLELSDYRDLPAHRPGWIAERLGLSLEEEARCLSLLEGSGQIRLRAEHWEVTRVLTVDTRRDPESTAALRAFWARTALERMQAGQARVASYNVFGVSSDDMARLRELYVSFFRQARALIAQSEPVEQVALMNFQLVPLSPGDGLDPKADAGVASPSQPAPPRKKEDGRGENRRAR